MTIFLHKNLTRNPEIPLSEFDRISGDYCKLGISNLAQMSLMKCYWMLQNSRLIALTVSQLLRKNQQGGWFFPFPTQIRVKNWKCYYASSWPHKFKQSVSSIIKNWLLWGSFLLKRYYTRKKLDRKKITNAFHLIVFTSEGKVKGPKINWCCFTCNCNKTPTDLLFSAMPMCVFAQAEYKILQVYYYMGTITM